MNNDSWNIAELEEAIKKRNLSMTLEEAERLAGFVGRLPTPLEFHLFDTMWSEHCSYKSSREILRTLPTKASQVVLGPGEDAGVVKFCSFQDVEYDLVVAHESHNHPSQVLPVEGAATGIGGIVRDVYCMGARVIGSLDILRFGNPTGKSGEKVRSVARGVVEGIWKYGNALGVPNLGGDTVFDSGYDENCLVNVVAIGLVRHERVVHSFVPESAKNQQYVLILVGKPTDNTGFGGATFASADLEEKSEMKAVQVADPFLKRVLSEANMAVLDMLFSRSMKFGFKDLGAGGIACVSSEMAAQGGLGIVVDLNSVPVSMENLSPEIIACAETQERYGLAVPETIAQEVLDIYNRDYELTRLFPGGGAAIIGEFTKDKYYRVLRNGKEVACAPIHTITEGIIYKREEKPVAIDVSQPVERQFSPEKHLRQMLLSVEGCSRKPVWSYYDSEVQGNTHLRPGEADSMVVVPVPGCPVGLAVSAAGNPYYGRYDPYLAGAHAVGEAVRNVVTTGAIPIAATDCLNYGNPEVGEVFWQFRRGVDGISAACRELGLNGKSGEPIPIVSGNVSFYNQSSGGKAIPPSPVVAVFGRIDDFTKSCDITLKKKGNLLILVGKREDELGGSLFYRVCLKQTGGNVPSFRGNIESNLARFVLECISSGIVESAHDISEGGMLIAAAEMALVSGEACSLGIRFKDGISDVVSLCSETPGYLLEISPGAWETLSKPPFVKHVGFVTDEFSISGESWKLDLGEIVSDYEDLLARIIWREKDPV